MLDQNTDRMWYVIGAVIVGAAIIFLANGTLPSLFASVTDSFSNATNEAVAVVDGLAPGGQRVSLDGLTLRHASIVDYDELSDTWTLDLTTHTSLYSYGFRMEQGSVRVPYGYTLTYSYDVWSPIDAYAVPDVNNVPDGVAAWAHNDNDDHVKRTVNGVRVVPEDDFIGHTVPVKRVPVKANEWTTITFTSSNTSDQNTNEVDLLDFSNFGIHNHTDGPLRIQIRNIQGVLTR